MWRLVREDRSLRFWRVLILDPPTRRRRCNLSTFSVAPSAEVFCLCTQNSGCAARSAHRNKRVSQCEASTFPRHRTRCARRCLLQLRCCTPLPLCNTLFQRLALLSDTSLVQSAFGRAFSLRSPLRARDILSSPSFPHQGALALFALRHFISRLAAERICRQWNTSANILRFALHGGQRHGSTSSDRSGSEQDIAPTP